MMRMIFNRASDYRLLSKIDNEVSDRPRDISGLSLVYAPRQKAGRCRSGWRGWRGMPGWRHRCRCKRNKSRASYSLHPARATSHLRMFSRARRPSFPAARARSPATSDSSKQSPRLRATIFSIRVKCSRGPRKFSAKCADTRRWNRFDQPTFRGVGHEAGIIFEIVDDRADAATGRVDFADGFEFLEWRSGSNAAVNRDIVCFRREAPTVVRID